MRKKLLTLGLLCHALLALGQEQITDTLHLQEVQIVGTRFEVPVEKSGKTIYKISKDELEKSAGSTVADLLNKVPGLQMDGNFGNPGSNLSYYVRGGRNRNTLILIDGVPQNDPSGVTSFYDLRYLSVDQIESIEILNGGLSTLYGSGAAAGVISIKLKEASDNNFSGTADINAGSYNSWNQYLQVGGVLNKFTYLLSGKNTSSKGFSSAEDLTDSGTFDDDGFSKQNGMLKLGYNFSERFKIDLYSSSDRFVSEYDDGAFTDADNQLHSSQFKIGFIPSFKHKGGELILKTQYTLNDNEHQSSFPQRFIGKTLQVDFSENYVFNKNLKAILGLNVQHMSYEEKEVAAFDDSQFQLIDPYLSTVFDTEFGLNIHAGIRLNTHSVYDNQLVYNLNPSYLLSFDKWKMKLRMALSTSYITPSLYQINSIYGKKELNPEKSLNYEGGFDIYAGSKITFSAVYFKREESDLIDFVSLFDDQGNWVGGNFDNVQKQREVEGVELNVNWKPLNWIDVNAFYSHNYSDDDQTYYRIPNDKWGMGVSLSPLEKLSLLITYLHTGERTDFDYFSFTEVTMNEFDMFNVNLSYTFWNSRLKLYGAVNNITDTQNIGVHGFNSMGRNGTIGASFSF